MRARFRVGVSLSALVAGAASALAQAPGIPRPAFVPPPIVVPAKPVVTAPAKPVVVTPVRPIVTAPVKPAPKYVAPAVVPTMAPRPVQPKAAAVPSMGAPTPSGRIGTAPVIAPAGPTTGAPAVPAPQPTAASTAKPITSAPVSLGATPTGRLGPSGIAAPAAATSVGTPAPVAPPAVIGSGIQASGARTPRPLGSVPVVPALGAPLANTTPPGGIAASKSSGTTLVNLPPTPAVPSPTVSVKPGTVATLAALAAGATTLATKASPTGSGLAGLVLTPAANVSPVPARAPSALPTNLSSTPAATAVPAPIPSPTAKMTAVPTPLTPPPAITLGGVLTFTRLNVDPMADVPRPNIVALASPSRVVTMMSDVPGVSGGTLKTQSGATIALPAYTEVARVAGIGMPLKNGGTYGVDAGTLNSYFTNSYAAKPLGDLQSMLKTRKPGDPDFVALNNLVNATAFSGQAVQSYSAMSAADLQAVVPNVKGTVTSQIAEQVLIGKYMTQYKTMSGSDLDSLRSFGKDPATGNPVTLTSEQRAAIDQVKPPMQFQEIRVQPMPPPKSSGQDSLCHSGMISMGCLMAPLDPYNAPPVLRKVVVATTIAAAVITVSVVTAGVATPFLGSLALAAVGPSGAVVMGSGGAATAAFLPLTAAAPGLFAAGGAGAGILGAGTAFGVASGTLVGVLGM